MKNNKTILGFAAILLMFVLVCLLFPLRSKPAEGPQIILEYYGTHPDGKTQLFIPKGTIALGITPLGNPAPLNRGDLAICRISAVPVGVRRFDGKDAGDMTDVMFRCGDNKYIFQLLVTP